MASAPVCHLVACTSLTYSLRFLSPQYMVVPVPLCEGHILAKVRKGGASSWLLSRGLFLFFPSLIIEEESAHGAQIRCEKTDSSRIKRINITAQILYYSTAFIKILKK